MSQQTPKDKAAPTPQQRVRRQLTLLLVVIVGGGYAMPRWVLQWRSQLSASATDSAAAVYQQFHDKARWIKSIGRAPGHRKAAQDAMYTLRRQASAALKRRLKSPGQRKDARKHLTYLLPRTMRQSTHALRSSCMARQSTSKWSMLWHPKLSRRWHGRLYQLVRMDAMSRGHTARLGWLAARRSQGTKPKRTWTLGVEQTGLALIAAGRPDQALAFWRDRFKARRWGARSTQLQHAMCSLYADAGQDKESQRRYSSPRCRAFRAWALLQKGQRSKALALLSSHTRTAGFDDGTQFLVHAVALAMAGQWDVVTQHWRRWQQRYHTNGKRRDPVLGRADALYWFNPIFTRRVPPALLATLQQLAGARLQARPSAALHQLYTWLLVRRGRQAAVLGQPLRAAALLRQALDREQQPATAISSITLAGLIQGPSEALAGLKQWKVLLQATPAHRRTWSILQAIYSAQLQRWDDVRKALAHAPCGKVNDEYQSPCRVLQAMIAPKSGVKSPRSKQGRSLLSIDPLAQLLRQPAAMRAQSTVKRVLRYTHPDLSSPALWARLLVMQRLDETGALTHRQLTSWHCERYSITPGGHLLVHYLRERTLRLHRKGALTKAQEAQLRRLATYRRRLGRIYGTLATRWINDIAM